MLQVLHDQAMTTTPTLWGKMRRFFDWLVKGLDSAAERKCAAHELERVKADAAAERKGLIDAHERHMSGLQAQIKQIKADAAHEMAKLQMRQLVKSAEEIAKKIKTENLVFHEKEMVPVNFLIEESLREKLIAVSNEEHLSVRQILTGMVALTWPSK